MLDPDRGRADLVQVKQPPSRSARLAPTLLLLAFIAVSASTQVQAPPAWRVAARKNDLSEPQIERLERDHVLIGRTRFKQVFQAYGECSVPIFITSDSVLNGLHVLFEESFARFESANAIRLKRLLGDCWAMLPRTGGGLTCATDLLARSRRRAIIVLAVARALLDEDLQDHPPDGLGKDLEPVVQAEMGRVSAARAMEKPGWLGPPDPGFLAIDYGRCKPRGFYTRSKLLRSYFRAVSWLQAIPFRSQEDEELLSVLLLGRTFQRVGWKESHFAGGVLKYHRTRRHRPMSDIIGLGDDWDVFQAGRFATFEDRDPPPGKDSSDPTERVDEKWLDAIRARIVAAARKAGHVALVNDQIRLPPGRDADLAKAVGFRILPAYRTPSGILFGLTTNPEDRALKDRRLPTGLEIAALLGSEYAMSRLAASPRVQQIIGDSRHLLKGSSLFLEYLRCLQLLVDEPEPDAPPCMKSTAWQAKSTNAVLAGWAQMRHTFVLQAKMAVRYWGGFPQPPGFVEPEPEFFGGLARLVRRATKTLEDAGALGADHGAVAADLRGIVEKLESRIQEKREKKDGGDWGRFTRDLLDSPRSRPYLLVTGILWRKGIDAATTDADRFDFALRSLRELIAKLEAGRPLENPALESALADSQAVFRTKWESLERMCTRLQILAHKQLRGVPFLKDEARFIANYGRELGRLMGHEGHAFLSPRDTAPKVADVFSVPELRITPEAGTSLEVGTRLEVAIARPRALWVLYPWQGSLVLCRGAVLPYYEFQSKTPLTDAEWMEMLDVHRRPDAPEWLAPLQPATDGTERASKPADG